MTTRVQHADILIEAAEHLTPLDLRSPLPQKCLEPAVEKALLVWKESASYIDPHLTKKLRIAIVACRNLLKVANSDASLRKEDIALVREAADTFRETAKGILVDRRTKAAAHTEEVHEQKGDFSPRGLRMTSFGELVDAKPFIVLHSHNPEPSVAGQVSDNVDGLARADAMHRLLPKEIKPGMPQIETRMPIIAYPQKFANKQALDRSGFEWQLIKGPKEKMFEDAVRNSGGSEGSTILLFDQVLIGLRYDDVKSDHNLVKETIAAYSKRNGAHTNPLGESKTLKSPGNPVAWLWLVPDGAMSSGAINVRDAAFPWMIKEDPKVQSRQLAREEEELKKLEEQQEVALRLGNGLQPKFLARMTELRESIDRLKGVLTVTPVLTPHDKVARIAQMKKQFDEQVKQKFASLIADIKETQDDLNDLKGADEKTEKERKRLKKETKDLTKQLDDGKAKLAAQISRTVK